jgi:hypothetical protein
MRLSENIKKFGRLAAMSLGAMSLGGVSSLMADTCWPAPEAPQQFTYCRTEKLVESGGGKDFGPMVTVASSLHAGWKLVTAAFWLEEKHPCSGTESSPKVGGKATGAGSWSECFEDSRDGQGVKWRVRMQGVEDNHVLLSPAPGYEWTGYKITSPAVLITLWKLE